MANGTNICRLCLNSISNNFEELDGCKIRMLNMISLELNLALISKPMMCLKCSNDLQQIFDFKSMCLTNDVYLKTFIDCDHSVKLILEEIVQGSLARNEEEGRVCRFCLRYLDAGYFIKLNASEEDIYLKDMLQKCLPEIDLKVSSDPVMCEDCMDNLQTQFNFVLTCLHNEENIKIYASNNNNNHHVSLTDVVQFFKRLKPVGKDTDIDFSSIKLEIVDYDAVKTEIVVKDEGVDYYVESEANHKLEEVIVKENEEYSNSRQPPVQSHATCGQKFYTCSECPHRTNRKASLELHHLIHKDLPRSKLFKCDKCDFVTKWRTSLPDHQLLHKEPQDVVMYQCAHCPYKSKYKKHLRRHINTHIDIDLRKFHCQYCRMKTADKWYFKQHNKVKHGKVVVIPKDEGFACEKCPFESKYKTELDAHKKNAHNIWRFTCHCGYATQKLYDLKDHALKSHDEVAMLQCEFCDFQAKYRASLQNHLLLHKTEKAPKKRGRKKKERKVS